MSAYHPSDARYWWNRSDPLAKAQSEVERIIRDAAPQIATLVGDAADDEFANWQRAKVIPVIESCLKAVIEQAEEQIRADERERCAKVIDALTDPDLDPAAVIRRLGPHEQKE